MCMCFAFAWYVYVLGCERVLWEDYVCTFLRAPNHHRLSVGLAKTFHWRAPKLLTWSQLVPFPPTKSGFHRHSYWLVFILVRLRFIRLL